MAIFGRKFGLQAPAKRLALLQDAGGTGLNATDAGNPAEINLANILLMIPADIVTLYMTGKGLAQMALPGTSSATPAIIDQYWGLIVFVLCAVACFLFRLQASRPAGSSTFWRDANWPLALWTTVAFLLWAHAVSDVGPLIPWFAGARAAFVAGLFGVFAPKLVRADTLTS